VESCWACQTNFTIRDLKKHQDNELKCSQLTFCPNECKDQKGKTVVLLSQLASHLQQCPNQLISCFLCLQQVTRAAYDSHLSEMNSVHFLALLKENSKYQQSVQSLKKEIDSLKETSKRPKLGNSLLVRYGQGAWFPAIAYEISAPYVKVRYFGFAEQWDEKIDYVAEYWRLANINEIDVTHKILPEMYNKPHQVIKACWKLNGCNGLYPVEGVISSILRSHVKIGTKFYHFLELELPAPSSSTSSSTSSTSTSSSSSSSSSVLSVSSPPTLSSLSLDLLSSLYPAVASSGSFMYSSSSSSSLLSSFLTSSLDDIAWSLEDQFQPPRRRRRVE